MLTLGMHNGVDIMINMCVYFNNRVFSMLLIDTCFDSDTKVLLRHNTHNFYNIVYSYGVMMI